MSFFSMQGMTVFLFIPLILRLHRIMAYHYYAPLILGTLLFLMYLETQLLRYDRFSKFTIRI